MRGGITAVAGSHRRRRWGGWLRRAVAALAWMLLGALLAAGALFLAASPQASQLHGWHRLVLADELNADNAGAISTLERYEELEDALWAELRRRQAAWPAARAPLSRYNPNSPLAPGIGGRDWNRTFELGPETPAAGASPAAMATSPRCAVLLLHGLSDSPYSLRTEGQALAARGHHVVGLRLPGHGLAPGALRDVSWHDWRAAVRLGARQAVARSGGAPLVIVGYSNGAALALDYALQALDDPLLPVPRRLVFLSPALAVARAAALARGEDWLGRLPGLEALRWESVVPEYDPYKFNSFPINAAAQIYALTNDLDDRLEALADAGRGGELPPTLVFQSVADATVPTEESLHRLFGRTDGGELVLFDLNREAGVDMFLAPGAGELADAIDRREPWPFDLTLVTNADPASRQVVARRRPAGSAAAAAGRPLDLAWPERVYSLSHVAVPFPPDDPLYGLTPPPGQAATLGSVEARGERGVLVVPQDLLMRLRSNPFYPYLEERLVRFVEMAGGGA